MPNVTRDLAADPATVDAVRSLARLSRVIERASDELSLPHYRVLNAIGAGDERASRVAAKLSLGKPTVSASVDALVRRGLITRAAVGDDQRAVALSLTAEGRAVLDRVESAMVERLVAICRRARDPRAVVRALAEVGALEAAAEHRPTVRDAGPA